MTMSNEMVISRGACKNAGSGTYNNLMDFEGSQQALDYRANV